MLAEVKLQQVYLKKVQKFAPNIDILGNIFLALRWKMTCENVY